MPRGDKPTTVALALKDGWVYEDTLPASITKEEYDWWFRESLVLDGVRMGPPLATKPQSTTEPKSDDDPHRWEVEPHPWSSDFDYFITDNDAEALTAIQHAAEMYLWDGNECGERILKVRLNTDVPETQSCASVPASAAPVVDEMITVLADIRGFYSTSNCWCDADGDSPHFEQCERAAEFYERLKLSRSHAANRSKIICLCGSTRFIEQFAITTWELEREGYIVLGCTLLPMWYCKVPSHFGEATGTKQQCDQLHLRKIDLADEVLVLNIGGYIGESTANEIAYASRLSKPIRYIESESAAAATAAPERRWFERLGDKATAEIVNATADLVTDERLAALVDAKVLPSAAPVEQSDEYAEISCAGCGRDTDTKLLLCPTCVDSGHEGAR